MQVSEHEHPAHHVCPRTSTEKMSVLYSVCQELPHTLVVIVQWLSRVRLFVTPWTAARQASLSFTISQSLLKFMSTESMMLSNHLILRL